MRSGDALRGGQAQPARRFGPIFGHAFIAADKKETELALGRGIAVKCLGCYLIKGGIGGSHFSCRPPVNHRLIFPGVIALPKISRGAMGRQIGKLILVAGDANHLRRPIRKGIPRKQTEDLRILRQKLRGDQAIQGRRFVAGRELNLEGGLEAGEAGRNKSADVIQALGKVTEFVGPPRLAAII